jgi:hypothetical protein
MSVQRYFWDGLALEQIGIKISLAFLITTRLYGDQIPGIKIK